MVYGHVAAIGSPRELKQREGTQTLQEVFLSIVEKGRAP